jgi:hypothetical protein
VVLVGERRHLQRDPGRRRAGEDLVALADQILAGRDGLGGIAGVVGELELDRLAVDLVRALRGVVEAEPQPTF